MGKGETGIIGSCVQFLTAPSRMYCQAMRSFGPKAFPGIFSSQHQRRSKKSTCWAPKCAYQAVTLVDTESNTILPLSFSLYHRK